MTESEYAFELNEKIMTAKYAVEGAFFCLGGFLKEMRDGKYYKVLGFDYFKDYLEQPERGIKHATAYKLIGVFELYTKLGIEERKLLPIGITKLDAIAPVVEKDIPGWLAKAETLSKSDLINEVRAARGKPEMEKRRMEEPIQADPISLESPPHPAPCLLHPERAGERAHFPITEKMGGKLTLPLCRECHNEMHNIGVWTWAKNYAHQWSNYLYSLIYGTKC
jgi:hypothetical protein